MSFVREEANGLIFEEFVVFVEGGQSLLNPEGVGLMKLLHVAVMHEMEELVAEGGADIAGDEAVPGMEVGAADVIAFEDGVGIIWSGDGDEDIIIRGDGKEGLGEVVGLGFEHGTHVLPSGFVEGNGVAESAFRVYFVTIRRTGKLAFPVFKGKFGGEKGGMTIGFDATMGFDDGLIYRMVVQGLEIGILLQVLDIAGFSESRFDSTVKLSGCIIEAAQPGIGAGEVIEHRNIVGDTDQIFFQKIGGFLILLMFEILGYTIGNGSAGEVITPPRFPVTHSRQGCGDEGAEDQNKDEWKSARHIDYNSMHTRLRKAEMQDWKSIRLAQILRKPRSFSVLRHPDGRDARPSGQDES